MKTTDTPLKVQRHELKYYLSRTDYEYARILLATMMDRDTYSPERGYPIRSLYFDDISDSSVIEKLDGIELRDKYRLRTYDPSLSWVKLERKRKHNNYITKTSIGLTKEEAEQLIALDASILSTKDDSDARSLYVDFTRKMLRPVVLIDYVREAYTLPYNEIRITFDKELRINNYNFDMFDTALPTIPIQQEDIIIMEIKYNVCLPSWITPLLHLESATPSAISKYTQSRIGEMDSWWAYDEAD